MDSTNVQSIIRDYSQGACTNVFWATASCYWSFNFLCWCRLTNYGASIVRANDLAKSGQLWLYGGESQCCSFRAKGLRVDSSCNDSVGHGRESVLNIGRLAMAFVDIQSKARSSMTLWLNLHGSSTNVDFIKKDDDNNALCDCIILLSKSFYDICSNFAINESSRSMVMLPKFSWHNSLTLWALNKDLHRIVMIITHKLYGARVR